jgi:prolyl-tRNA editing enzyme YbaK/EbsC (Cys-tRNA(Pro) deacylase)
MNIDEIVSSIGNLDPNQRAELTAKLSAAKAEKTQLRTLRAARATKPENHRLAKTMLAHARAMNVDCIQEDQVVDLRELNAQMRKHEDLNNRLVLRGMLFQLGMIDP